MARLEAQSDKDMGEDDDETAKSDDPDSKADDDESFVQVKAFKRNIDDEDAEAAEMAHLEAQSDKDMGEDDDETAKSDGDDSKADDDESFVQVKSKRNIDDENAEAAEMARLEAQSDKDMGEDDDESAKSDDDDSKADDDESFVQVKSKRNIDDENAEAAEMARLE